MNVFFRVYFLVVIFTASVLAQTGNINRNLLPLGDQEAFSSNTGTARRGSSGGVYYNPAVLAFIPHSQISISGSTYMNFDHRAEFLPGPDNTRSNSVDKGFNAIPTTVVSTMTKGNFVGAFSVIVPENLNFSSFSTQRTANQSQLKMNSYKSSELWLGLSAGWKMNGKFSVGVGLHMISNDVLYIEQLVLLNGRYPARESMPSDASVGLTNFRINAGAYTVSTGLYYRIADSLDVGFKVQSRSVQQWEKVDGMAVNLIYRQQTLNVDGLLSENTRVNYRLPIDSTLGFCYNSNAWKLLFDISRQGGHKYNLFPDIGNTPVIETENTFRYNLGMEFDYSEKLQFLGGLSYNPSAVHSLKGKLNGSREDYSGMNLGVYLLGQNTRTGVGVFYMRSNGEQICGNSAEVYFDYNAKCSIHTKAFGVMLSTGFVF